MNGILIYEISTSDHPTDALFPGRSQMEKVIFPLETSETTVKLLIVDCDRKVL